MSSNRLTVNAADASAEISVLDGCLNRVARGIGRLEQDLAPGLYKVRVRVGPTVEDELVSLDQDRTVTKKPTAFPSAIPLTGTSRTHEYHMGAAIDASRTPRDALGRGGSVMVFAREWTGQQAKASPQPANPADGLTFLSESAGAVDIATRADLRTQGDASAGWRADVDPGPYRLRLTLSDGTAFERALYVSPGQQTQVFLMRADYALADGGVERRADLAGGGVVISPSQVFQPDDGRTRLAELARYALAQKRRALSDEVINDILDEKGEDPMLGLLGAHLLLRDEPENHSFFETVIGNLLRLLGPEHPDVHALRLRARPPPPPAPLSSAPMLRASWDLAAVDPHTAEVIPETGPTGVIATRILPSAPWLVWSAGAAAGTAQDRAQVLLELLGDFMKARDRTLSPEPATSGLSFGSGILEGLRSAVSGAAGALRGIDILASGKSFGSNPPRSSGSTRTTRFSLPKISFDFGVGHKPAAPEPKPAPPLDDRDKAELSRTLGLPGHVLEDMLKRLSR